MNETKGAFARILAGDQLEDSQRKSTGSLVESELKAETSESEPLGPETVLSEAELGQRGFLDRCFREPKSGSVLMAMKKGDLKGKSASKHYEKIITDAILALQSGEVDQQAYLLSRFCLGQVNSLKLAEQVAQAKKGGATEEQILSYLFNDKVKAMSDLKKYLRSLIPYHKDVIIQHSGIFMKLIGS